MEKEEVDGFKRDEIALQNEILYLILDYLDINTIAILSTVNKKLNNIIKSYPEIRDIYKLYKLYRRFINLIQYRTKYNEYDKCRLDYRNGNSLYLGTISIFNMNKDNAIEYQIKYNWGDSIYELYCGFNLLEKNIKYSINSISWHQYENIYLPIYSNTIYSNIFTLLNPPPIN